MIIPREVQELDTIEFCSLLKISKDYLITKYKKTSKYSTRIPSVFLAHLSKQDYGKLGGRMVDQLSAGLFTQLYDKAPDNIKEKMNKMNEKRLYIVIGKMWDKFGKSVTLR